MSLVRTYRPASVRLRAVQTLIDLLVGGVLVLAVFAIFAWLTLLFPLDLSVRQYRSGACSVYRLCATRLDESTNLVPLWYGLLVLAVALAALALISGALDNEGRTAGMRIMGVLPRRVSAGDDREAAVPRLRLVLRWWMVGLLAFAGSWVAPGAGALLAVLVGWLVVLAPGHRTLWDRATGVSVVEVSIVEQPTRGGSDDPAP